MSETTCKKNQPFTIKNKKRFHSLSIGPYLSPKTNGLGGCLKLHQCPRPPVKKINRSLKKQNKKTVSLTLNRTCPPSTWLVMLSAKVCPLDRKMDLTLVWATRCSRKGSLQIRCFFLASRRPNVQAEGTRIQCFLHIELVLRNKQFTALKGVHPLNYSNCVRAPLSAKYGDVWVDELLMISLIRFAF